MRCALEVAHRGWGESCVIGVTHLFYAHIFVYFTSFLNSHYRSLPLEKKLLQGRIAHYGNYGNHLTLFLQKFRESNSFTKELISRKKISVRENFAFLQTEC